MAGLVPAIGFVAGLTCIGHATEANPEAQTPRSYEQIRRDPGFVEDSADATVTMVMPRTTMTAAE